MHLSRRLRLNAIMLLTSARSMRFTANTRPGPRESDTGSLGDSGAIDQVSVGLGGPHGDGLHDPWCRLEVGIHVKPS